MFNAQSDKEEAGVYVYFSRNPTTLILVYFLHNFEYITDSNSAYGGEIPVPCFRFRTQSTANTSTPIHVLGKLPPTMLAGKLWQSVICECFL